MSNKGTTKIKAISKRALEIREKAGFTTETIVKKRYKMAYVPDAIKQAAKELKKNKITPIKKSVSKKTEPFKKGDFVQIIGLKDAVTDRVKVNPYHLKYGIVENYQRNDVDVFVFNIGSVGFLEKNLKNVTKAEYEKATTGKKRTVNTKQLSRRAGQSTKAGVRIAKAGVSASVASALRAVVKLKRFSDIDFSAARLLYNIKKVAGRFTIPEKEIKNPTIKMLLDGDYIEILSFTGKYKVTRQGAEFIKLVDQHIKNAKTDKYNPRLF